jgi:hypothetical protein
MTHVDFKTRKKIKKKLKIIHGRNRRQLFDERKEGLIKDQTRSRG